MTTKTEEAVSKMSKVGRAIAPAAAKSLPVFAALDVVARVIGWYMILMYVLQLPTVQKWISAAHAATVPGMPQN